MATITQDEIEIMSQYICSISGLDLGQDKSYLFETRLIGLMNEYGFSSFAELYQKAVTDKSKSLERKIIDAITTGETSFFLDTWPFELLKHEILPKLIDKQTTKFPNLLPKSINIWSSACCTGQEIYSIAIVLKELLPTEEKFNIKLLGTDISDETIARARSGVYNKYEIERGLTPDMLQKYFTFKKDTWTIKDEIREMATFKNLNLMLPFDGLGKFDLVFCRNLAIYLKLEDRIKLFEKIAVILNKDGYLIIGSSEAMTNVSTRFKLKRYLKFSYYQLKEC